MKKLLLIALALTGCAGPADPNDVAFTRQAGSVLVGPAFLTGVPDEKIGTSLAGCPEYNGSFVFGAPGSPGGAISGMASYVGPDGGTTPFVNSSAGDGLGELVACGHPGANAREFIAGWTTGFAPSSPSGTAVQVTPRAMTQSDQMNGLVMVSTSTGQLFEKPPGGQFGLFYDGGSAGFGQSLNFWPGRANAFVLGAESPNEVKFFTSPASVQWSRPVSLPAMAVAVGDFHPTAGPEVAVKQGVEVLIYSTTLPNSAGPVMVLSSPSTSGSPGQFGSLLATEPNDAGAGLNALWVGSPGEDRVYRFLGDAGDIVIGPMGTAFGESLAFSRRNEVIIGAPNAENNAGQLFRVPFNPGSFVAKTAYAMECDVLAPCSVRNAISGLCITGRCVGGVVCDVDPLSIGSTCTTLDGGNVDAGFIPDDGGSLFTDAGRPDAGLGDGGVRVDAGTAFDAGTVFDAGGGFDAGAPFDAGTTFDAGAADASVSSDAGVIDAGLSDAGRPDAGPKDAGAADGGEEKDGGLRADAGAGATDGGPRDVETTFAAGCTCQSLGLGPVWLFALALLRRRRR